MVSRKRLTHDRRVGVRRRSQPDSPECCKSRDTFSTSQVQRKVNRYLLPRVGTLRGRCRCRWRRGGGALLQLRITNDTPPCTSNTSSAHHECCSFRSATAGYPARSNITLVPHLKKNKARVTCRSSSSFMTPDCLTVDLSAEAAAASLEACTTAFLLEAEARAGEGGGGVFFAGGEREVGSDREITWVFR